MEQPGNEADDQASRPKANIRKITSRYMVQRETNKSTSMPCMPLEKGTHNDTVAMPTHSLIGAGEMRQIAPRMPQLRPPRAHLPSV
jgi:hypothetical protein